ncbi:RAVE protein 1 domain containing protein [Nitzschia inconspicua]|uniref:RAVE protein 1 domain containing protein n=1 Tax=Nitzschia inconspicua TaxID=303405 RepID=A0A9K3PPS7_9STRA|nr:RAVE protein 1 domain containing protein [Nitzschia inconspicua]
MSEKSSRDRQSQQHGRTNSSGASRTSTSWRVSGAADQFHRAQRSHQGRMTTPSRRENTAEAGTTGREPTTTAAAVSPPTSGNAPDIQNIDRATGGLPRIASSGFHVPPEVLGQDESAANPNNDNSDTSKPISNLRKPAALADLNKSSRKRMNQAVKAAKSKAAAAAAVKGVELSSSKTEIKNLTLGSSMVTFCIYRGMEVFFANASDQSVLGVCSRTNYVFQQLDLASTAPIVSITSNSTSGLVVVAHEDGIIQTYTPMETDPVHLKGEHSWQRQQQSQPQSVYGRFRWIDGMTINAMHTFYQPGESGIFRDRRQAQPGELLDISSSYDYKLLVAHRQQLAVFDVAPPAVKDVSTPKNSATNNSTVIEGSSRGNTATLSWTILLPSRVKIAKISGDGQAVVAVVDHPNEDGQVGAMTFLHDKEDGSQVATGQPDTIQRNLSIGMVYRPGPFLPHSTPVTRISFRGLGHVTCSVNPEKGQGNDLLLTYCEEDSAVRIFNQSQWRQIMMWAAPPNSRADWIRGSSAFSLGDLEPHKKMGNSHLLRPGSRRPSANSSELSSATGGINSGLRNNIHGAGTPISTAGAWIAEITFRGAYPALRLSRLSYMKRGNDESQAAHFESIAAMLPPGSIVAGSVLNSDDMGLSLQGVWPAWNPWLSEPSGNPTNETLSGSAMQFLGLSSVSPPNNGLLGESFSGGTHGPPAELRIVSSHLKGGQVVLMEFPLWGDDDFGAMELGSPIRKVLALSEVSSPETTEIELKSASDSMDYESSRLCAKTLADGRTISLLWRKQGSLSLYSPQWQDEKLIRASPSFDVAVPKSPEFLLDLSLIPVPLALPPLRLPSGRAALNDDTIVALKWWPDDSLGGPPLLVAVTKSSTLLVYEIPPPIFALEPNMPNFDSLTAQSSVASVSHDVRDPNLFESGSDVEESSFVRQEYDVLVTPHPDFGLGLRLESPMDGLPAIAGSFKKNPLNDGMLPAEKTGMIRLGDELLSVNGASLENMTFDDIIATVRHVGAEAGPGEPLKMRFRSVPKDRSRKNSAVVHESFSAKQLDAANPIILENNSHHPSSEAASLDSVFFKGSAEAQQEFGRLLVVIRKSVAIEDGDSFSDRFVILPWNIDIPIEGNKSMRSAAFMIHGYGSKITVQRLELPSRTGLDKARNVSLGTIDIKNSGSFSSPESRIRCIKCIEQSARRLCVLVTDSEGYIHMVYLHFEKLQPSQSKEAPFQMSHRHYRVTKVDVDSQEFKFDALTPDVVAGIQISDSERLTIDTWHARLDSSARELAAGDAIKDEYFGKDYIGSTIAIEASERDSKLLDFCFLETGCLESFPTIVAFLTSEAVVCQRRGGSRKWVPVLRLAYPSMPFSSTKYKMNEAASSRVQDSPLERFPHILQSIRAALSSYDEKRIVLSDWHPESLLALLCVDERGTKAALTGDVRRIFLWLADKMDDAAGENFSPDVPLLVAPYSTWGKENTVSSGGSSDDETPNTATSLLMAVTPSPVGRSGAADDDAHKLIRLRDTMVLGRSKRHSSVQRRSVSEVNMEDGSEDLLTTVNTLPEILMALHPNELRVLKSILLVVLNPPHYGNLDAQSQLTLTLYRLHKELKTTTGESEPPSQKGATMANYSSLYLKRRMSSGDIDKPKLFPQNASAGCLSALLSDYQEALIESVRAPGEKLDWSTVRDLRLPFWLRSDEKLRQVSEEVGQKMYRESKDILQSAVYFIVAGKQRTLMNLAAADSTDSGRKFYKFLTTFDFASERGRSAAEKNAFSLLRKNKYDSAAAFFLLAEPPILKSAVETIATKMEDLDLAFLVARLVGNRISAAANQFGLEGLGGFGGVLGGGGGYAGSGPSLGEANRDKEGYCDWKRKLNPVAKRLLLDRCLPSSTDDSCLTAVQLLWLGRFDEATHWVTGLVNCAGEITPRFKETVVVPQLRRDSLQARKSRDATISTTNCFLNLAAGPFLLRTMNASIRTSNAAVLTISRALACAGIEVAAVRLLKAIERESQVDSKKNFNQAIEERPKPSDGSCANKDATTSLFHQNQAALVNSPINKTQAVSSIFDSFEVAPPSKSMEAVPTASSSIFDAYEAAPTSSSRPTSDGQLASSIFDTFDTAIPRKQIPASPAPVSSSDMMSSSIFDSFDVPRSNQKKPVTSASGNVSSIFDSFDVTPQQAANAAMPPSPRQASRLKKEEEPDVPEFVETSEIRPPPELWSEWWEDTLVDTVARRLIRELSTICAPYHCDHFGQSEFDRHPIITGGAAQVLQFHCDGDDLMDDVRATLQMMAAFSGLHEKDIVGHAIKLLQSPNQVYRILYLILLLLAIKQIDIAEDTVRKTARSIIELSTSKAFSNDHFATGRESVAYLSQLSIRKVAAMLAWQMELCLWIHRGGALPLSGLALNEAICAVRIGYLIASWSCDFETQEIMMRQPPDCLMEESNGRQLWASLKIISGSSSPEKKVTGTGSGGWEFLVDCRRSEATELLRPHLTGCFIIRPHPEDHGVFTLSFKTNLIPTEGDESEPNGISNGEQQPKPTPAKPSSSSRPIKRDDVVQHAIIRLSDSGFRCGSFGPFGTLMKLLEAVSSSLPFDLRFDMPPTEGIIKDEGSKPSPNSLFLRKLALHRNKAPMQQVALDEIEEKSESTEVQSAVQNQDISWNENYFRRQRFGLFAELLLLSELRKQLSAVAAAEYDNLEWVDGGNDDVDSVGSLSDASVDVGVEQEYAIAARMLRPFLTWCRVMEIGLVDMLAPSEVEVVPLPHLPISLKESDTAIEMATEMSSLSNGGDDIIRRMIQPGSGVEFRTLRLGEGGESAMVVLFSKKEAVAWFLNNEVEKNEDDALKRLSEMERMRTIEPVDLKLLAPKAYKKGKKVDGGEVTEKSDDAAVESGIRYRLVDPWEVEPLESREAETRGASLGRQRLLAFGLGRVASSCEDLFRATGGRHLLELWAATKGGISLTKALATVHAPWERSAGGDLLLKNGTIAEPSEYDNAIREHLYRNALYRRLKLPQRFMVLIQVELLDLKNLTSPGGTLSLTVYSLLRLKRARSSAPLTSKARTLDSVATLPVKLAKTSGPNAPASWGSLVRFRYPLPENTASDGRSFDSDCESLFKGPPSVLQVSVYEKKFMSDTYLGGADVKLDGLDSGGQLEEWVPLKTESHGINWFTRIRLTLRFELMCLANDHETDEILEELAPSVGLRRIKQLCSVGGAQLDLKKSVSTPDLLSYFESMVY